jgi:hypothetical protein
MRPIVSNPHMSVLGCIPRISEGLVEIDIRMRGKRRSNGTSRAPVFGDLERLVAACRRYTDDWRLSP